MIIDYGRIFETMKALRGTSLYPGIGTTRAEMERHLEEAHEAGINAVFTSLQLPEADPEILMQDFPWMCRLAHRHGMLVSADIADRTATRFGIDRFDTKAIKNMGVDTVRLDGGFEAEEMARLSHNTDGVLVMMNASFDEARLKKIYEAGVNRDQVLFCHNYYPMRYTGLLPDAVSQNNKLIHKYGFRVSGFVAGKHHRRIACGIGLPTVETLRDTPLSFTLQAMLHLGFDDLFFGDDLASLEEMKALANADLPMTFRMKLAVQDEKLKAWLNKRPLFQLQGSLEKIVRSHFEHSDSIYPGNCEIGLAGERRKGTVMLGKKNLYRYCGEIQIARTDLPDDPDIGIIGQIIDEDLPLLDLFKVEPDVLPAPKFRIEIVD